MILAAGFGTRLAPLTDDLPKALVPVAGRPMIDHAIDALRKAGCDRIVVNAHHHASLLMAHCKPLPDVFVTEEKTILGTGGGILNAKAHLNDSLYFLVHNADIITDYDLRPMIDAAQSGRVFATLAVHDTPTQRAVVFDASMHFLGKRVWVNEGYAFPDDAKDYSFSGIHVISSDIFTLGFPEGFSDIFDVYRSALNEGKAIRSYEFTGKCYDLGSVAKIRAYEREEKRPPLP